MNLALMLTSGDIICNVVFTGSYYLDDKANALSGILWLKSGYTALSELSNCTPIARIHWELAGICILLRIWT